MSVHTGTYHFEVSCTAMSPEAYVPVCTSTNCLVPPYTRCTGFQTRMPGSWYHRCRTMMISYVTSHMISILISRDIIPWLGYLMIELWYPMPSRSARTRRLSSWYHHSFRLKIWSYTISFMISIKLSYDIRYDIMIDLWYHKFKFFKLTWTQMPWSSDIESHMTRIVSYSENHDIMVLWYHRIMISKTMIFI